MYTLWNLIAVAIGALAVVFVVVGLIKKLLKIVIWGVLLFLLASAAYLYIRRGDMLATAKDTYSAEIADGVSGLKFRSRFKK